MTVVDQAPGRGASWAAAGMLAPVTEVHYGERPLLGLNLGRGRPLAQLRGRGRGGQRPPGRLPARRHPGRGPRRRRQRRPGGPLPVPAPLRPPGRAPPQPRVPPARARPGPQHPRRRPRRRRPPGRQPRPGRGPPGRLPAGRACGWWTGRVAELAVEGGPRDRGACWATGSGWPRGRWCWPRGAGAGGSGAWRPRCCRRCGRSRGSCCTCAGRPTSRCASATCAGLEVYVVPRGDGRVVVGATVEEQGFDTRVTAGGGPRPAAGRAGAAARRGRAGAGRDGGRPAARVARQRPHARPGRPRRAWWWPPATTATASCSPRSPPTPSPSCWPPAGSPS